MHVERSRLLILLVLVSVVCAASWSTCLAGGTTGLSQVPGSSVSQPKPQAVPTSGEPDVGQTPHPVSHAGLQSPGPRRGGGGSERHQTDLWFSWIFRVWMVRVFGAR